MDNKKSYYAVIPADVRYNNDLCPNAKLLYGEITALCNGKHSCLASNKYFAGIYGVHKNTVSKWISQLNAFGFIGISYDSLNDRRIHIPKHIKEEWVYI